MQTKSILLVSAVAQLLVQASNASVIFQLSEPGAQESVYQGQSSYLTENFDSLGGFIPPGQLTVGSYMTNGPMTIQSASKYGGAGGTGSYAFTNADGELSVSLGTPSKYIGLWFSCSNPGNYIDVFSNETLLATFDTQSLTDILGLKTTPNSVLASDGKTYSGALWYGNPNQGLNDSDVSRFQYAYINMGLSDPNATFDKIVIRGAYFEFDNLTTSSASFTKAVPEPSAFALLGLGALGLVARRRRCA